jgi:hypothetical protein
MAGDNNHFSVDLPGGWKETTVYTFEGPHDSGVQHNLVLVIDQDVPNGIGLERYARMQSEHTSAALPGYEFISGREITLPSGFPAYETVHKYVPAENTVLFQKQVTVVMERKAYVLTSTFSKKTLKTIANQVDCIIASLRPLSQAAGGDGE